MRKTRIALALMAGMTASLAAQAALLGRDLNGSPGSFEAYYDDQLNITWLADANLAASNPFGLAYNTDLGDHSGDSWGANYSELIRTDGRMNWGGALHWIDAMNTANYLGYHDWRLPTLAPASASFVFSTNGTQTGGYGDTGSGWGLPTDPDGIWSELGWMYYHNLGNLGYCPPDGGDANPSTCDGAPQAGWGLVNTTPFLNLQSYLYWSGLEYAPNTNGAWSFFPYDGGQGAFVKFYEFFAWAVRPGDVAAASGVPEPGTVGLLALGLLGLGLARRRG